jgi:hypothetical protein
MHNIDKSAFRKGEYIGYCARGARRIHRYSGGWETYGGPALLGDTDIHLTGRTLKEISKKLEKAS